MTTEEETTIVPQAETPADPAPTAEPAPQVPSETVPTEVPTEAPAEPTSVPVADAPPAVQPEVVIA
jgi:hypothetical protein